MKKLKKDDIVEHLATGQMSRRQFNQSLMALGATMVMMPAGSRSAFAASDDHPTVFTWEGWDVPELHQPYLAKHGESPNMAIFGDEEEAFAKMRAGFKVDLTQPCTYKVPIWKDAGILDGDLVAVHRTPEVRSRQIVVARLDDEVTVKRYRQNGSVVELLPENEDFEPIVVDLAEQSMVIEGVVVGVIRDGMPLH